jgi:hypothetical protein
MFLERSSSFNGKDREFTRSFFIRLIGTRYGLMSATCKMSTGSYSNADILPIIFRIPESSVC